MSGSINPSKKAALWIIAAVIGVGILTSRCSTQTAAPSDTDAAHATRSNICTARDFSVSHTRIAVNEFGVTLTGIVTNGCEVSAGPELKWTAYYQDGSVAFSDEFWPAGTINLAPHERYPFEYPEVARPAKWRYTLNVIGVDRW